MALLFNLCIRIKLVSKLWGVTYWLWKFDTIPKIKHYIWLFYHNSVPIWQVIAARGISCNTSCPLCQSQEESILHLLRDCPFALKFWKQLGTPQSLTSFLQLSLLDWIKQTVYATTRFWLTAFPRMHNSLLRSGACRNIGI